MTRAGAARPDTIRRHNLGLLLAQVHRDGELTRAQLTNQLGLSRSTIGALVADLTDLGLLHEHVPNGGARAGRPSHVVGPRDDGPYAVAVDVDVTHVTIAAVGIGGRVLVREHLPMRPSPPDAETVASQVAEAMVRIRAGLPPDAWPVGVGVSVPGAVSLRDSVVEFAPNLNWRDEALGAVLARFLPPGMPVLVGNDADLAVRAEHLRGNARECDDVVLLLGRIGVGAGLIANGAPVRGHDGYAGELGHTVMDLTGVRCRCGKRGCMETFVGEGALLRQLGRRQKPTAARVAAVLIAAREGDREAARAVQTVGEALGRTVAWLVNALNPERVILCGFLAAVFVSEPKAVERSLSFHTMGSAGRTVELTTPAFGDDAVLLGAAELAFADLVADPLGHIR